MFGNSKVIIPTNVDAAIKAGVIPESKREETVDSMFIDLASASGGGMSASQTMIVDLIASSIADGWKRPVYFATTIPESLFMGFSPYMLNTGMAYQITPIKSDVTYDKPCNTDKMYDIVTKKFKWGGLDKAKPGSIYLDETVIRMVTTTRSQMLSLATALLLEGEMTDSVSDKAHADDRFAKAEQILDLMEEKLPAKACPYQGGLSLYIAQAYHNIGKHGNRPSATKKAKELITSELMRFAPYIIYYDALGEDKASLLAHSEQAVIQQMIPSFFELYRDVDPQGFDELTKKFSNVTVAGRKMNPDWISALTMSSDEKEQLMQQQQDVMDAQAAQAAQAAAEQTASALDSFIQ